MKSSTKITTKTIEREQVLTTAVINASNLLGLTDQQFADVINVSPQNLTKLKSGQYLLEDGSDSFKHAALLVRLFRSIDAIAFGDASVVKQWMKSKNLALNACPIEMIGEKVGLETVVSYLESRQTPH